MRRSVKEGQNLDLELATYESSHSRLQYSIDQSRLRALASGRLVLKKSTTHKPNAGDVSYSEEPAYFAPSLTVIRECSQISDDHETIIKKIVVGGWVTESEARAMYLNDEDSQQLSRLTQINTSDKM
jgi:hypothetical protein